MGYIYNYYAASDNKTIAFTTIEKVITENQGDFNKFKHTIIDSTTLNVKKQNKDDQIWYYWSKKDTLKLNTVQCYEGCGQIYVRKGSVN